MIADPTGPGTRCCIIQGDERAHGRCGDQTRCRPPTDATSRLCATTSNRFNPKAWVIEAASPITLAEPEMVAGKRALVVEDGPTVTHGEMSFGAGLIAAEDAGATVIDPRPFAVGSIAETFEKYPHLTKVLPAMGYSEEQVASLQETIERSDCDVVVTGTPIDIKRLVKVSNPIVRARYELEEIGRPNLEDIIDEWWEKQKTKG